MERISVRKLARVLWVMAIVVLACNIIVLFFVPGLALMRSELGMLGELTPYENPLELPARLLSVFTLCWSPEYWALAEDPYAAVLMVFLLSCGVCTAIILWQGKRVLDTILKGDPFVLDNAKSLKRAAVCCFLISGAALARLIWGFVYYQSILPLLTYNALFVPIFLMGGLLFMVMSALFRQAAQIKAENDLTI